MNKINEYVKVELANLRSEKEDYLGQINRDRLNIESIDEMIVKLQALTDTTGNVFKAIDEDTVNEENEIASLIEQKEFLYRDIAIKEKRITVIDNKISNLSNAKSYEDEEEEYEILNVRENERERISREIHDGVVQKMTSIVHKAEFAQHMIDTDTQRAKIEMEIISKTVKECIDDLRNIIYNLRPMAFDDIGFKDTLTQYVKQSSSESGIRISLDFDDLVLNADVNSIILVSVFRIIQELTNNSIKHSNGKSIKIGVYLDKGNLIIKHSDDGIGISEENFNKKGKGFGISIIRERVKLLNGTIKCNHTKGTSYVITIPCIMKASEK